MHDAPLPSTDTLDHHTMLTNTTNVHSQHYFTLAKSWADDFYIAIEVSRNRWKALVLWVMLPIVFLLLGCILLLVPTQHLTPLLIEHYHNGLITVTPFKQPYAPNNAEQVESDIVRYIYFRESYSADTYNYSYRLTHLLSSHDIAAYYDQLQSTANTLSPINTLSNIGYRTVKIESISFLDKATQQLTHHKTTLHHNLAQVNFIITDHDKNSGNITSTPFTVLISWQYKGIPNNPEDRWMNWNGFTVTTYQTQQRNI